MKNRNLYHYGTDIFGQHDWRTYKNDYENGRPKKSLANCYHCGSNVEYTNTLGDLTCDNKNCITNRHKNDDGSRNYGEARKVDRSKYILIG